MLCVLGSQCDGLCVDGYGIVDIVVVVVCYGNGNWYVMLIGEVEDFLIVLGEILQG